MSTTISAQRLLVYFRPPLTLPILSQHAQGGDSALHRALDEPHLAHLPDFLLHRDWHPLCVTDLLNGTGLPDKCSSPTDTLLEKMQAFATSTYGADALATDGLETMHYERMGDVPERIEALSITKRFTSTGSSPHSARPPSLTDSRLDDAAKFMSQHRANSGSETGSLHRASSTYSSSSLGRSGTSSSFARPGASDAAPPAYSPPAVSPGLAGKRPPPPPPPGRPGAAAKKEYVTALYDYTAQVRSRLSPTRSSSRANP